MKNFIRSVFRSRKRILLQHLSQPESNPELEIRAVALQSPPIPRRDAIINKSAFALREDLKILNVASVASEIVRLKRELTDRKLRFTTWMGDFTSHNEDAEMGKLWENAWILSHADVKPEFRVLDAGGASTVFSFYLASKGCEVSVIDSDWRNQGILENAITVARAMNWNMKVITGDITDPIPYAAEYFDSVFCICVLEHLISAQRRRAMRNLASCLKPGGLMGLTIDYDIDRGGDKGLRFRDREIILKDLILPSGLALYGNNHLVDEYDDRFFLGALILQK